MTTKKSESQIIADCIRKVTVAMQNEIYSGRRSTGIDANDLIDILLEIADEIDDSDRI